MNELAVLRKGRILFIVSIIALAFSSPIYAEEKTDSSKSDTAQQDKLMIRAGWAYVFGASANVSVGGPVLGVGTNIDLTNTLGVTNSTDALRLDTLYRFNDRHAIGFSWYRVGLSGEKNLNQQIQIRDQVIPAGAFTQTSLSFNIYRLLYDYSFYRNDKVELGVSPGLYMMETKFNFTGHIAVNNTTSSTAVVNSQLTVPLPSIGLVANYNITPKLQFQSRYDFFYLTIGQYQGSMFEFYGGLEYRVVQHFALGAAYDRLQAGLRGNEPQSGFNIGFSYNLLYLYATLYAF